MENKTEIKGKQDIVEYLISGSIVAQKGFIDLGIPALYIPDYYNDPRKYEKYGKWNMEQYQCRTSGVLQECVFLDIIPIMPELLLKQNQISGLGYHTMESGM